MCVVPRQSEESDAVGIPFICSEASHFTVTLGGSKCCTVFGKSLKSLQTFEKVILIPLKGFLS